MNDLTMIEPACFRKYECEDGEIVDVEYNGIDQFSGGRRDGDPLYTAAKMEAYAAAKVREALEEAAQTLTNTMMINTDSFCGATARYCAERIRSLIPKP